MLTISSWVEIYLPSLNRWKIHVGRAGQSSAIMKAGFSETSLRHQTLEVKLRFEAERTEKPSEQQGQDPQVYLKWKLESNIRTLLCLVLKMWSYVCDSGYLDKWRSSSSFSKEGKKILRPIPCIYLILLKTYMFSCSIVNEAHVESIYIGEKQMVQSLLHVSTEAMKSKIYKGLKVWGQCIYYSQLKNPGVIYFRVSPSVVCKPPASEPPGVSVKMQTCIRLLRSSIRPDPQSVMCSQSAGRLLKQQTLLCDFGDRGMCFRPWLYFIDKCKYILDLSGVLTFSLSFPSFIR